MADIGQKPRRKSLLRRVLSPGEIYRSIIVPRDKFESGEKKLFKKKEPDFVIFCKNINSYFPGLGKGAKFNKEQQEAVDFLGWDLSAEQFAATSKFVMLASVLVGAFLGILIYSTSLSNVVRAMAGLDYLVPLYIFSPVVIAAICLTIFVQQFPLSAARTEQTKALTYVPEIIGYMIMSMKLVPNLEKAVEFSASHGRGKISEDFKKLMWDVQLGVYVSLSEGLDRLAYRWGKFSDEFKRALMRIRASVLESTDVSRYDMLDKTMETVLVSIKDKMEQYARNLQQPAVILFYIGILLPLILIIVLPIGSAFSGQALATPIVLILIYNVLIPLATLVFANHLIKQRPPTYEPPVIPDSYPTLPKKYQLRAGSASFDIRVLVIIVLVAGSLGSYFVSVEGIPPKSMINEEEIDSQILHFDKTAAFVLERDGKPADYYDDGGTREIELIQIGKSRDDAKKFVVAERTEFFMLPENDVTPYNFIFGLFITFSACVFIYFYYTSIYKRQVQIEIMQMESEFKDSLYVLASRMGENKPVEEALRHARDFLPEMAISKRIFARTIENIELMGMPLEQAVFDSSYGSLKNIPSNTIQSSMKLMIDSVNLGVNVAARSLISLSLQLNNSERVSKMLTVLVSDITQMMRTMAVYIAPIVLGITVSLQKVVMLTLSSIVSSGVLNQLSDVSDLSSNTSISGLKFGSDLGFSMTPEVFQTMVTPMQFLLIVMIYVIELVIILVYFTTKIEEDNTLLAKINIAKSLPIAIIIFVISAIISNMFVGGFLGG